ncbi:hypothetical protein [Ruegeria profundi]|uniref:hypothetical protein n=1 Tax=Ruegeria profundi TaxID=1685378 RepID=UPI00384D9CEA
MAIPLLDAVTLLQNVARDVGPDAPFRMIDQRSVLAIGLITGAVSRATTLGNSFHNIAKSMHTHCTHESLMAAEHDEVPHISEGWSSRLGEDETLKS